MTETYNFEFVQGEEFDIVHDIVDDDDPNEPDEIEAGTTAEWRLSKYPDSEVLVTITDANIEKLSYNPGILKFRVDGTESDTLRGNYYHELEIDEPTYGKSITMVGSVWVEDSNA